MRSQPILALALAAVLAACGDSGTEPNRPPAASFTFTPSQPLSGTPVSFNGSGSTDPDGSIVNYRWDFGGGATATGASVQHTFAQGGSFVVSLTVTDDAGATASSDQSVVVTPSMSGSWRGNFTTTGGSAVTLRMILVENSGSVTGSGAFDVTGGSIAFNVSGSHAHPSTSLTISAQGVQDTNYSGTFSGNNSISGQLNGSGFVNQAVTLTRQ